LHWIIPHALADESRWYVLKVAGADGFGPAHPSARDYDRASPPNG
jgi:hypothetical protein